MKRCAVQLFALLPLCLATEAGLIADTTPLATARQAGRLLDQATWGPTLTDIKNVQSLGLSAWIDQQFSATASTLPDQPLLDSAGVNVNTNVAPVRSAFFQNAVTGPDQLRQRVTFILSQIFVVSQQAGTNPAYAYPPYWKVLNDNAFGNFSDIIKAVTYSPAMGRYLTLANNNKANAAKGTSANENYGRELMQLFTLGLNKLDTSGNFLIGTDGNPELAYTQTDVTSMARALTGLTYPTASGAVAKPNNPEYYFGSMAFVDANHDTGSKVLFGQTVPAGQSGPQDLDFVVHLLVQQPSMAPFICRQLIEHLVTSNPSPQYISRVSSKFLDNGSHVTGDMKAVIKAILLDDEARANDVAGGGKPNDGHLREPILMMTSMLRGLNATLSASNNIGGIAGSLGESLFDSPSVFSYFSPSSRTEKGLYGPEFQIYSTQTAPSRSNMVYNALYGSLDGSTKVDLSPFNAVSSDPSVLADYIASIFLDSAPSPSLKSNAISAAKGAASPANAVKSELFVVLTSAEYQVIH